MSLRGGRYEIIRTIASGGMAVVHLGRALGVGGFERLVAVKVMHPHVASEPECVDMFLDEARLAARIRHPNVVGTIDVSEDEQGVFLVMEYVEGPSFQAVLRELKKKKADRPLDVMLRIFIDALHGLHAAHELDDADGSPLNLVHRDVSPQNILVGVDGIARITDFGVARAETRLSTTQSGQIKGKFAFMAPEQVRMLPVDRRADVYAAGVLLWEILTGKKLVEADNELAIITQILTQKWQLPHEVNEAVPRPLSDACMRAIQASPDARYPTTTAFAEALEVAAKESGVAIATARQVSTFIRELNAHESPGDLGPVSNRPNRNSMPPSSMASRPPPPVASRPPPPPSAAATDGAEPTPEPALSITQENAALTSSAGPINERQRRRKSARLLTMAVAAPVVLIAGWLIFRSSVDEASGAEDARQAAPPQATAASPVPMEQTKEPAPAPTLVVPAASRPPAEADDSDAGAAVPAAAPSASPKPARATVSPVKPPVFRPREL
jgi:serine/threonine-protein kinase